MSKTNPIYGTDFSKELSQIVQELRHHLVQTRGQMSDITFAFPVWKNRLEDVEGLLTCGLIALSRIADDMAKSEITRDDAALGPSLAFNPRGIGCDVVPACFVCGNPLDGYSANIAAFVNSEVDGRSVVEWFGGKARLDFRPSEPNWIQVKVGTCEQHLPNLEKLFAMTGIHARIREATIREAAG